MHITPRFVDLLAIYRAELLERVVPFWLEHAVDWQHGGLLTCIADDGTVLSTDKYLWSQLRAIWTFSALYNRIEPRQEWLDVARHIYDFVRRYGRDEQGRWVFAVDQNGRVLQGADSIFADGFAIYGLTELARATGDAAVADLALETFRNVQARLAVPGSYGIGPFTLPENGKAHAISMIFSLVFDELGDLLNDPEIIAAGRAHCGRGDGHLPASRTAVALRVRSRGRHADRHAAGPFHRARPRHRVDVVHDAHLPADGRRCAHPAGCGMHSLAPAARLGRRVRRAVPRGGRRRGRRHGGVSPTPSCGGRTPSRSTRCCWPMSTAASRGVSTGSPASTTTPSNTTRCPQHGEWTQRLDRTGKPFNETVALPVKDPFHLPRALILCIDVLQRLAKA